MHTLTQSQPKAIFTKQRVTMILFFATFLIPVLVAYALLATGWWKDTGAVNNGVLLNPAIVLDQKLHHQLIGEAIEGKKPWLVMNILKHDCTQSCQNALLLARQSAQLLGPDAYRVKMVAVHTTALAEAQRAHLQKAFPNLALRAINTQLLDPLMSRIPELNPASNALSELLIVDPLGNAMLMYTVKADPKSAIIEGKGFVKDLERLLKLSRIG